jgi:hypothetical protein
MKLSQIVTGLRYVKSVSSKLGSHLRKEPDEIFVSFDGCGPPSWIGDHALVGTPIIELPTFPPHFGFNAPRRAGSLKFIAWPHIQRALVLATDPNHISDIQLGFIDLADIADMEEVKCPT